jgi:hypothetical protein
MLTAADSERITSLDELGLPLYSMMDHRVPRTQLHWRLATVCVVNVEFIMKPKGKTLLM